MLSRMGCGFSVASFRQLRRAGGALEWFEQQLDPTSVRETKTAGQVAGWFPRLQDSPALIWHNDRTGQPVKRSLLACDH